MRTYTEATEKYPPVAHWFFSQKRSMNHVINLAIDKRFGFVDTSHSRLEKKENVRKIARSCPSLYTPSMGLPVASLKW